MNQEDKAARIVCEFMAGQPQTTFVARRPAKHDWSDLSSLDSVLTLTSFTGGEHLSNNKDLERPEVDTGGEHLSKNKQFQQSKTEARFWGLLGVVTAVSLFAVVRTIRRLKFGRRRTVDKEEKI